MNMRNILVAAVAAAALASIGGNALAAGGTISTTAPASVTVLSPTNITKTQDMAFGSVVKPSNASTNTVILSTSDTVSLTGAGNGSIVPSTVTSAKFNITAPAATTYSTTQTLAFSDPGLTGVAPSLPVATTGTLGVIPAGGAQEIRYGAQFDMTASTPVQTYNGTLTVTVNYP
jgi:hypothetical protein